MRTGTPGFIAARLTEAREARGLSQTGLAALSGLKSQSISHYEQGRQSPSPEALAPLCDALQSAERFFLRAGVRFDGRGVFFRGGAGPIRLSEKTARVRAERRLGWLKEVALCAARYVELPKPALPSCPLSAASDLISAEEAARATRAAWGLGAKPVSGLLGILEARGCMVSRWALEEDLRGALSHFEGGAAYLVLDSGEKRLSCLRWHAAHELGHLVMHRQMDYFLRDDRLEAQADRFARAFLMPAEAFAGEVWAPNIDALMTLKKDWCCPLAVMIARCGELGVFDAEQVRRAGVSYARRGWKDAEPREVSADCEQPRLLAASYRLMVEQGRRDRHGLLKELALHARDVEELAGLPGGYLAEAPEEAAVLVLQSEGPA